METSKILASCAVFALAQGAFALPTISIDNVAQRWPWNNKVDITYTVADGGQDLAAFQYRKIVFTANIGGTEYTIDGSRDVFAPAADGTYTVTWTNAPSGVTAPNSTMIATIKDTTAYYMIVDLDSGRYVFTDLEDGDTTTAVPTASNARYNTAPYKEDLLVLRRVPRSADTSMSYSQYATGGTTFDENSSATLKNSSTNWVTTKDYFIGIFELTIAQYNKLGFSVTATVSSNYPDDIPKHRPLGYNATWNDLRNSTAPTANLTANATSVSYLERLNAKTDLVGFDLPTEAMWEIAARSGTNPYQSGTTGTYSKGARPVGRANSNTWGIYDIVGNVSEMCRDDASRADMGREPPNDALVPAYAAETAQIIMRGSSYNQAGDATQTKRDWRGSFSKTSKNGTVGFRVAFVAE